ncbi:odorant receptor 85b [Cryptotermes secundus]|uniref:odorant receptor 85b n=1 Tax=Cryptotermes secundus TaxID=105785 RepID=UPI001454D736|nr:odorant receptor 85b [Cryptotermes secundus]
MDAIMFLAEEEEEKKKYVRELRFLESRKLSGRTENMSLGGEPQYTGLGSPVRHDIQEWKVCDNVVDTDIEDGWMEKEDLPELTRYLANFVEYHQTVIDFASDVNKAVGPIFFVCFFVRQFLGCVTSFQVALMWGQDNSILKFIFGFVAAMCSPMIFCWYGTAIIENSRELQKAAFECQWYKHSKAMKHFLLMITVRSQKAVYLSGCQYYVVSLQTFGKMMNTMYAYFTLLKNQYKY